MVDRSVEADGALGVGGDALVGLDARAEGAVLVDVAFVHKGNRETRVLHLRGTGRLGQG